MMILMEVIIEVIHTVGVFQIIQVMDDNDLVLKAMVTWGYSTHHELSFTCADECFSAYLESRPSLVVQKLNMKMRTCLILGTRWLAPQQHRDYMTSMTTSSKAGFKQCCKILKHVSLRNLIWQRPYDFKFLGDYDTQQLSKNRETPDSKDCSKPIPFGRLDCSKSFTLPSVAKPSPTALPSKTPIWCGRSSAMGEQQAAQQPAEAEGRRWEPRKYKKKVRNEGNQ